LSSVHDALLVRRAEAVAGLERVVDDLAERDRPGADPLPQAFAFEELHGRVHDAVFGAEIEDGQDVRMREGGDGLGLALEPRERLGILRGRLGEDLDRYDAVQLRVARAVDLAHAARAELRNDLIGAETPPGIQWHAAILCPKQRLL
jgi:hypothetical protein